MTERILLDEEDQIQEERIENIAGDNLLSVDLLAKISNINLKPVVCVLETQTLFEVIEKFKDENTNSVLVMNEAGESVGIFTENDIVQRVLLENINLKNEIVGDHMTINPEILEIEDSISYAMNRFVNSAIKHLPIKCNGKLKYMLRADDLIHYFSCNSNKSVLNLQPDPHKVTREINGG